MVYAGSIANCTDAADYWETNHANASFQHLLQFCSHCLNPSKAAAEEAETFMLSDVGR